MELTIPSSSQPQVFHLQAQGSFASEIRSLKGAHGELRGMTGNATHCCYTNMPLQCLGQADVRALVHELPTRVPAMLRDCEVLPISKRTFWKHTTLTCIARRTSRITTSVTARDHHPLAAACAVHKSMIRCLCISSACLSHAPPIAPSSPETPHQSATRT